MAEKEDKNFPKSSNTDDGIKKTLPGEDAPSTSGIKLGEGLEGANNKTVAKQQKGRAGFSGGKVKVAGRGGTIRPIVPAEKAELVSVANAMHGKKFGKRLKKLFQPETNAAIKAVESGIYIGWRCPEFTWDCIRVGEESLCFCGHKLHEHRHYNGPKSQAPCSINECQCRAFAFIPSRPEDVGEFWLQRRRNFDPSTWKAKCRCKHPHTEHSVIGLRSCKTCRCAQFESNFLCSACDQHWEKHETFIDTEATRVEKGLPYGEEYLPFAEIPQLRNMALTGKSDDSGQFKSITNGGLQIQPSKPADNNTPVPFGYHKSNADPFGMK
uniref:Protein FAM221B n=1 Tax=Ciona intestinalis TaxID=7719 RepID=F6VKL4_CIOIN|nr:protein FAM221B [Ciona intestinalis]|eukprot:XP_002126208.1 protein FAM221B [Ciona intestinalis]